VLGAVARLWLRTLRVTVELDPALEAREADEAPWVLAFHHGKQWALLAWQRRKPTAALVSLSDDGVLFGAALARLGLRIVRGSTSRGGARALFVLSRLLRDGEHDVAVAVDGPRGPRGVAKPGALALARLAKNARVVPMGSAVASGRALRSWDRFELAWPFSRVAVVLGAPLDTLRDGDGRPGEAELFALSARIDGANAAAAALVSR
jgi:lysophospholipid acyltransferase (LPLAT)-like uncharacterized protein